MPLKIGRLGQLQEWIEDVDDPNCHHRHFMHLIAVHPCQQINPHTDKALAEAARVSMNLRGDGNNAQRLDPDYATTPCSCTHCGAPAGSVYRRQLVALLEMLDLGATARWGPRRQDLLRDAG